MSNCKILIDKLGDIEVVALLESLSEEVADKGDLNIAPLIEGLSEDSPEMVTFIEWAMNRSETLLDSEDSATIAKSILYALVDHPQLGPYVCDRAEHFVDPRLGDIVLSLGVAASMIFIAISTRLDISYNKTNGLSIELAKEIVSTPSVKEVLTPMAKVATTIQQAAKGKQREETGHP